jgi:hypothetical protein
MEPEDLEKLGRLGRDTDRRSLAPWNYAQSRSPENRATMDFSSARGVASSGMRPPDTT